MKTHTAAHRIIAIGLITSSVFGIHSTHAAGKGWSIVPYVGLSQLGDQSPSIIDAEGIAEGTTDISVERGFTAGLSVRYDYEQSPWVSEFGWEYRSNDSITNDADGIALPDGNYASNTFYINGRYTLKEYSRVAPWIGAGVSWIQEIDLDSEDSTGERSFSDSGSIGFQAMVGADYNLSERLYLTSEIRYSSQTGLNLVEEGGNGRINGIDYQPVTLGIGLGFRF